MHPLLPVDLTARSQDVGPGASLGAVADGLTAELAALIDPARALPLPERKARLTRHGGRCPVHGTYLEFDPWQPHTHWCRQCNRAYQGEAHDDWWAMGAQLWTAERAVHAAALHALRGGAAHRHLAERILEEIADRYSGYPNRDNVLGPSRPFFSTYLESVWLLNLCHALALLECLGGTSVGGRLRDRVLAPSAQLIDGYNERDSNRQVWNDVATTSARLLLGESDVLERRLTQPWTTAWFLAERLDEDGMWFEGENYHLFAHRGLWYGMQLFDAHGIHVGRTIGRRFLDGFVAPFLGMLPDETLPSRRDSAYRVSVRQWRFAEYLELGRAECQRQTHVDGQCVCRQIASLLTRLYDGSGSGRPTERCRSLADTERNEPAARLSRADMSWRGLLMACAKAAPGAEWTMGAVCRDRDGLAAIRRSNGRVYVALEGGATGGGHGHPDRLALTLQDGTARWLEDPGTGSYVDPSLAWYRSTLAHHAPLVDRRSQLPLASVLTHMVDSKATGWMRKEATLAKGVVAARSVVVCDGYLVDVLTWDADDEVTVTLPIAAGVRLADINGVSDWRDVGDYADADTQDGFAFLIDPLEAVLCDGTVIMFQSRRTSTPDTACEGTFGASGNGTSFEPQREVTSHTSDGVTDGLQWDTVGCAWYAAKPGLESRLVFAESPGPPGCMHQPRLLLEQRGRNGQIAGVWRWIERGPGRVDQVDFQWNDPVVVGVTTADGTTASHSGSSEGWTIDMVSRATRHHIALGGARRAPSKAGKSDPKVPSRLEPARILEVPCLAGDLVPPLGASIPGALEVRLAAEAYIPTEEPWEGDNRPVAHLAFACTHDALVVRVGVLTGHPVVSTGSGLTPDNPLDNEPSDVNADGLQWYIGNANSSEWSAGELMVPVSPMALRRTAITHGLAVVPTVTSRWLPDADGWVIQLEFDRRMLENAGLDTAQSLRFDLIVNERPPERERRRGQLRLSGGGGFGYLRGVQNPAAQCMQCIRLAW